MSAAPATGRTAEENETREAIAACLWLDAFGPDVRIDWALAVKQAEERGPDSAAAEQVVRWRARAQRFADALLSGPLAPLLSEAAHLRTENANLRDRVREAEKGGGSAA